VKKALVALLPLLVTGCYLCRQAQGELGILMNARDVEAMLVDPSVSDSTKEKLRRIADIKAFGECRMNLAASSNYTTYYDTQGKPITYLVSACRPDRFEPYLWWFPIVGSVPYKGFFDREDALSEARALEEQGYDVSVGETAAFSTLGWFKDPVLSTMLDYPEEHLAALILHELTHGTVYLAGGTEFNEGLATFVGWEGALQYARERHGTASEAYDRAVRAFAREERRDAHARELYERLDAFYRSSLSPEQKIELRHAIAGGPVNNAEILMHRRYGRYDQFRKVFERAGGNWARFFEEVRRERPEAPQAPSGPSGAPGEGKAAEAEESPRERPPAGGSRPTGR
jgi:predicted aminopeptidase